MRVLIGIILSMILLTACTNHAESVIAYSDIPAEGDVTRGEELFSQQIGIAPTCSGCHNQSATASPILEAGYAEVASERVDGQSAHEYTFWAIVEPSQHLVEGYGNAMYNQYDEQLSSQQIADLIAYLLSL